MKGNKKLLIVAVLLLLVAVSYTTYAIYRSETTATGTVQAANWSVKVDNTAFETANFTFTGADITWTGNPGQAGTIAPGATGYIDIPVDADGSQVDVILTAVLGSVTLPDGMTVALADGADSQTIAYSATEGAMEANVRINIAWTGTLADTTAKDSSDKAAAGTSISIPVTLTARQKVSSEL